MQTTFKLLDLLKVPFLYNLVQDCIGGNALRRRLIKRHVRAKAGDKVIDIGCGPAQIMPWLPAVEYLGFDVSEAYIVSAKRKYHGKGIFVAGDTKAVWDDLRFRDADIVTALAVLRIVDVRRPNVRTEQAYRYLAEHVFQNVTSFVDMKPMRIPYVTVVLECEK